mgnify:CR=1 FL=1
MKENWVKIFSSHDLVQVKLAEDLLKQKKIESHILNKPDTMMPMLGEAELYTLPEAELQEKGKQAKQSKEREEEKTLQEIRKRHWVK